MSPPTSLDRIALFHPLLTFGGIERVMLSLAGGFLGRGIAVDHVVSNARGDLRDEVPEGARLFDLQASGVAASLPHLVRYLRRERPPVLLSGADHANTFAIVARAMARAQTRIVISQHSLFSESWKFAFGVRGRIACKAARWTYPYADALVGVSRSVSEDLARALRIPESRVQTIYNPAVTPKLEEQLRAPLSHPWLKKSGVPVILSAGRLSEQKGFATLLRAFAHVRGARPARLIILGDGPERQALEQLTRELDICEYVDLPGFVQNPPAWFARADVFALPSLGEGFSLALVEAMAAGARLVSTDCPGPREVLAGGRYGILVPVADAAALGQAILSALEQPKPSLPAEALDRFTLNTAVERYVQVLSATLTRP
jgi:glycosyltransferase involved in cell wall biosynthesis